MSAGNDTRSNDDLNGRTGVSPDPGADTARPGGASETSARGMEIVWSSASSTGSGWRSVLAPAGRPRVAANQPEHRNSWPSRHVVAFESDLLDNAVVHWEQERPTLEMIAGYKQDDVPETDAWSAESIASGQASAADELGSVITQVGSVDEALAHGAMPFQPDMSNGAFGPAAVPKDGIEDPRKGWRPTGMVFFETLSTPPRGTVYSSTLLDAFWNENRANAADLDGDARAAKAQDDTDTPAPFFDFPEEVAPAPPDETEDFPLQQVVITGGSGGGGGTVFLRLFGRLVILGLALMGFALVGIVAMYLWYAKQRIYDDNTGSGRSVVVTITPGENFRSVINEMSKDGLLKSFIGLDDRYLMRYLAYFYEDSDKIKPGVYRFDQGQNLDDVYRKLVAGSKDYRITVPEGKTALEVGQLVAKQYSTFDAAYFNQLIEDPVFIKSVGIDAPSLEGYLYPSTYYFGPGMKEEELVKLMVSTFHKKMEGIQDKITTDGLTLQEHIIMASLIEREARVDEDRPLIASVIFNRLDRDMPLQIDATVNFALDNWRRLNYSDYETSHPYNTYKIKGLPPGPITSPRAESILATYTAPETNYLYYVHKGDGHHAFAETYAQHQANVGRYIRERNIPGMASAPSGSESSTSNAPGAEIHFDLSNSVSIKSNEADEDSAASDDEKRPALADEKDADDAETEKAQKADQPDIDKSARKTPAPKSY